MGKKQKKSEKFYTVSDKKIAEIKENAKKEGISEAFVLMLGLSVMTIHDHFNDLRLVNGHDKCREERFTDYVLNLWESHMEGYITLQDCLDVLEDECGLKIIMKSDNRIL